MCIPAGKPLLLPVLQVLLPFPEMKIASSAQPCCGPQCYKQLLFFPLSFPFCFVLYSTAFQINRCLWRSMSRLRDLKIPKCCRDWVCGLMLKFSHVWQIMKNLCLVTQRQNLICICGNRCKFWKLFQYLVQFVFNQLKMRA